MSLYPPLPSLNVNAYPRLPNGMREAVDWDTGVAGFGVRLKPSGSKSDAVQYRNRSTGRSQRKTMGQVGPLMSFASAKADALRLKRDVMRGGDPAEDDRTATRPPVAIG